MLVFILVLGGGFSISVSNSLNHSGPNVLIPLHFNGHSRIKSWCPG
jgi:hypothetical protein